MSTILVTGATGAVGSCVVQQLLARQHRVRIYTHQARPSVPGDVEVYQGDIRVGSGLTEAMAGVDALIHCASSSREDGFATDLQGSRHLIQSALAHGSPHLVYISIVGIERSQYPYYQTKLEVEHMIEESGLPWTILRTTQFHDFVWNIITSAEDKNPEVIVLPPGLRFQSIDTNEVAQRLVELAEQQPAQHVPDSGGPQVLTLEEMAETYLRVYNKKSAIQIDPQSTLYAVFRSGVNIVPERAVGHITWEAFLRQRM